MLRVDSNVVTYKQQAFYLTSAKLSANTLLPSLGDDSNHMTKSKIWRSCRVVCAFSNACRLCSGGFRSQGMLRPTSTATGAVIVTDGRARRRSSSTVGPSAHRDGISRIFGSFTMRKKTPFMSESIFLGLPATPMETAILRLRPRNYLHSADRTLPTWH